MAKTADDAEAAAAAILGWNIKGHTVHRVMIAAGAAIAEEFYFSLLLDRAERRAWPCAPSRAAWTSSSSP